ncbi:hypothetical protein FV141_14330 (plasmid) [Dermacoccus abyssi]|uniref:DUF4190 domain-containing protein n=1 Tax=Dermacoccus abyssi TaxID=322596 RepID=A0ABX5ZCR2_9MICO|nr:hypothetical protein FV141_14330 [Dermacoccus abyssi]
MSTTIQLLQHANDLLAANPIPNPRPRLRPAPRSRPARSWPTSSGGTLFLIVIGGLCGVGALIGGKVLGHHKSASVGVGILIVAVLAAILWTAWFGFISGFTG